MAGNITVTGTGTSYAKPDVVRVSGVFRGRRQTYREASEESFRSVSEVRSRMRDAGLDDTLLRTASVSVDPAFHEDGRCLGFDYRHMAVCDLPVDGVSLGMFMEAMDPTGTPMTRVEYVVSDPSPYQDEARRAAVRDAMHKARVLAEESGYALGGVESIEYGPSHRGVLMARASPDAVPMDAEFEESVTIRWALAPGNQSGL